MSDRNLDIWSKVEKTSSKHVKPVTNGGRTYSSINPTSQKKKATEILALMVADGVLSQIQRFLIIRSSATEQF